MKHTESPLAATDLVVLPPRTDSLQKITRTRRGFIATSIFFVLSGCLSEPNGQDIDTSQSSHRENKNQPLRYLRVLEAWDAGSRVRQSMIDLAEIYLDKSAVQVVKDGTRELDWCQRVVIISTPSENSLTTHDIKGFRKPNQKNNGQFSCKIIINPPLVTFDIETPPPSSVAELV